MTRGAICFDFDGAIVHYDRWRGDGHVGRTMPGAIEALKAAKRAGYRVVIFTARTDHGPRSWIEAHGLDNVVDEVTNVKPKDAVHFFDDRATNVPTNQDYALSIALLSWIQRADDEQRVSKFEPARP